MLNEKKEQIAKEYVKPFFAFAIKKTNNAGEAEELAQEIIYQVINALSRTAEIENLNAYIWSIAHNTYKRWLNSKRRQSISFEGMAELYGYIIPECNNLEEDIGELETVNLLRREISLLTKNYRKAIVHYYYDEFSCEQIAEKLHISSDMVKFYLFKGRQKIKEGIGMPREYGEMSFNPSAFSIYWSGGRHSINIWQLFKRKLPGNIVLAAYENPITVSDLSLETGVPVAFLEDEIIILKDAGLIKEVVKDKFQTNFFIVKKMLLEQIKTQMNAVVSEYVDRVEEVFTRILPEMKALEIFQFEVPDSRYKWLFMQKQSIFDIKFSNQYPQILTDGSRGFVWGEESKAPQWSGGRTPYFGDGFALYAIDIARLGYKHQDKLRDKGELLAEIARGNMDGTKTEQYAELIKDGYAVKCGRNLYSNIPVLTSENSLKLNAMLEKATESIRSSAPTEKLLANLEQTIKNRLTKVVQGSPGDYASLILSVHIGSALLEAMYMKGYINVPEDNDNTPYTSYIELK